MSFKVSVVIPTINIDNWLEIAIQSILDSKEIEVELLVVLDGVDEKILPDWSNDPRVSILRIQERSGQANAMNEAIALATNELIARLDADDFSSPTRLINQALYLLEHPETIAIGTRVMRVDKEGNELGELVFPTGEDIRSKLLFQNVVPHSSLMFRKSALIKIGYYRRDLRQMEDYEFILRLASLGPIANLNSIDTFYRIHGAQISRGVDPREDYIKVVTRERLNLARQLKKSILISIIKNFIWVAVQKLRFSGYLRSGVDRY